MLPSDKVKTSSVWNVSCKNCLWACMRVSYNVEFSGFKEARVVAGDEPVHSRLKPAVLK
jgi:hypothetical protein